MCFGAPLLIVNLLRSIKSDKIFGALGVKGLMIVKIKYSLEHVFVLEVKGGAQINTHFLFEDVNIRDII